jgi:large subunit ribosomal protein L23
MYIHNVLKRPVDSEKTRFQGSLLDPQYTFVVDKRANKQQVKAAVEQLFSVSVVKVRIVNAKPKRGRYGRRIVVRHPGHKKAIVTLGEGQRLDIFEGV